MVQLRRQVHELQNVLTNLTDDARLSTQEFADVTGCSTPIESQATHFQGESFQAPNVIASNVTRSRVGHNDSSTLNQTNSYNDDDDHVTETPLTIPVGHLTTTGSLLSLPQVRSLIGYYPQDIFLQLESQRTIEFPSPLHSAASLDFGQPIIRSYIETFFDLVYPSYPIMNKDWFSAIHANAIENGSKDDFDTALLLVVIGFGMMVSNLHDYPDIAVQNDKNGMKYFTSANQIIAASWIRTSSLDIALSTSLIYGAMYMSYLDRPIQMWKLINQASSSLQFIISQ